MNKINHRMLLYSKWTAVAPLNREKHFMVVDVEYDDEGLVISTKIEAVLTKRVESIEWTSLNDSDQWLHGWK